jgi:urease accessory protein UreF
MRTDLSLLRLQQLFDSQFPVGAFAHSGGVETYASLGGGVAELREIIQAQIALGWGRSELGAAHLAWRAEHTTKGDSHLSLYAQQLDALKVVPAVRHSSLGLGRRTLELLRRIYPEAAVEVDPPHPIPRRRSRWTRHITPSSSAPRRAGSTSASATCCSPTGRAW